MMSVINQPTKPMTSALLMVGLIALIGFSRYIPLDHPALFNFSPTLAIFLFCGAYLRGMWAWIAPACAIFLSDLMLNPSYGLNILEPFMLATLGSYLAVWMIGKKLGKKRSGYCWTFSAIGSGLLFHIITCSFAWIMNPAYNKTLIGLIQALTIGEPGFAPAYLFLRNSILGTVFFALCLRWAHLWLHNLSNKDKLVSSVSQA
ncbi:hypothetical protein N9A58_01520 [Opitutales bacterium]|nr:hypothetical protein [Opitutales bacterium]